MASRGVACLLLLLSLCYVSLCRGECDKGVFEERLGNKRVAVFPNKVNWFKASEYCRKRGLELLTIRTEQENMQVIRLGRKYQLDWVWTAATDLAERREWIWSTDGSHVRYKFWRGGEPSSRNERCVEVAMSGHPRNWNDNDCRRERAFICEENMRTPQELREDYYDDPDY